MGLVLNTVDYNNIITPKDMPSPAFRIGVTVATLAILLIIGAIYYSNINL